MEPCHSVSPRSPAYTSAVTVAHLIRNIEQLKNKDKLISQLEKDLGHQWVAAHLAALEREHGEGTLGSAMSVSSHPLGVLPEDSYDPTVFSWTATSTPTTGGVEDAKSSTQEGCTSSKQDLPKRLKDCKEKNKELVEKCRVYLRRNKELTAQNRAYKDSSEKVLQENKKMQELLEHSKLRVLQLTRNLSELQTEKSNLEQETEIIKELKKQLVDDKKMIDALKQACVNKDRRIELMQHRKRKRRLAGSAEKSMGVKETFFGYQEDTRSVDSENSSLSHSTVSDEDVWDEVLSMEEMERNYQRLMMEHLQLQRSYAQLQGQCQNIQDPQREAMIKMTLQNDLFNAQCRIEKLEKLINEVGEGEIINLIKARETILSNSKECLEKAQFWEKEGRRVQCELNKALERCEDLEFQLMELEQANDATENSTCEGTTQHSPLEYHEQLEKLAEIDHQQHVAVQEMEQLQKELVILLKGKGREGDAVLKKLEKIANEEKKRAESLESIAAELQKKVICLQKEKDVLYDQINHMGQKQGGKGDHSATLSAARERQENLELKNQVALLSCSESKLLAERMNLIEELDDWRARYDCLKQQLDIVSQSQNTQMFPSKTEMTDSRHSDNSSSPSPTSSPSSTSPLTRKPSKDRKSKPRSGDDPMETKRRRSSKDTSLSDETQNGLKRVKSSGDMKSNGSQQNSYGSFQNIHDIQLMTESADVLEQMRNRLKATEFQLQKLKEENSSLQDQLRQCALEKSSEAEADQQILLDKLEVLEAEVHLLRKENGALAQRLKQRFEEYQEELSPRVTELEDYCEDLQERLHASEIAERQLRDKLRLFGESIDDAESSELALREKYEELLARDTESKKQIQELQRTGRELRDIVLDKDIVEQALRDKVDFLQKAEAASSKRIDELEVIERELREQLEAQMGSKDVCRRELHKIQELKHQITFLETDNKALLARIAELEENEETLRENWRRVADEDFNRTQCLEEKVKMLESLNRDLKSKLSDAQEYYVINTVPSSENSLAAELARSQFKTTRRAATFDEDFDDDDDDGDSVDGGGSDSTDTPQVDVEKKNLKDKLKQLERQLSDVAEEKNTKIEALQEKIVSLKENEVKLSETISELEMTERELRAKLALYESSEVTVEKMLKYQSKIEELRTSQESLLDQIESMENQGMTLQEKMQETERTLRGKIVTLEVEMRGFKQRELKNAARIRELEKQEKELSEKVAQQAEKENGLYVKISSLMDELKKTKDELESLKTTMLEKEDKVRRANLLEVKFLEKEMEYGKKISDLSTKLRHKEEELRQKEAAHKEEMASLHNELSNREAERAQQVTAMEKLFAQKERDLQMSVSHLNEEIQVLVSERDEHMNEMKKLRDRNTDLMDKDVEYSQELDVLRHEVTSIKMSEKEYEEKIHLLQESLQQEEEKALEAEKRVILLEKELAREKKNVLVIENQITNVKSEIGEKMKNAELSFVEKENEYDRQKLSLEQELSIKDERVKELEKKLDETLHYVRQLESECAELKAKAAVSENETMEKLSDLGKILLEKDEEIEKLQTHLTEKEKEIKERIDSWDNEYDALKEEVSERDKLIEELKQNKEKKLSVMMANQEVAQNDLKQRLQYMNAQLLHEAASREEAETALVEAESKVKKLSSEIEQLKKEIEQMRMQLLEKTSELELNKKEISDLSHELSNVQHSWKSVQVELENFKRKSDLSEETLQNQITAQNQTVGKLRKELDTAMCRIQELEQELLLRDSIIKEAEKDKDTLIKEKQLEIKSLIEDKMQKEVLVQQHMEMKESEQQNKQAELESLKTELHEKDILLQKQMNEKNEMDVQIQASHSQIQTLKCEIENLSQKLNIKSSEAERYLQEIEILKEERKASSSEVELLQKEIVEKHNEIEKRTSEQMNSQSLISYKEDELEQARIELQKCLQEIQEFKNKAENKEHEFQQENLKCSQMSADLKELNTQLEKHNEEYKHLESKIVKTELKLTEAENRYRELEAKCASLELKLQESYAEAQVAEKVIRTKEEECQQLETKLTSVEKECAASTTYVREAEKILLLKDREFRQLELKLDSSVKECEELKAKLIEAENKHRMSADKVSSLEVEHQQLKYESSNLRRDVSSTQTLLHSLQTEIKVLKQKLADLERIHEQTESQLKDSENRVKEVTYMCENVERQLKDSETQRQGCEIKMAALQSEIKSLESKHNDTESELKKSEQLVVELEKATSAKDKLVQSLQQELKDIGLQHSEAKLKFEKTESYLTSKSAQYDAVNHKLEQTEQALRSSEETYHIYKEKLDSAESTIRETNLIMSELTAKISSLEKTLTEKESFCRDSQNDLSSWEQKYLEVVNECSNLRSQLISSQKLTEKLQTLCDDKDERLNAIELDLEHTRTELNKSQDHLSQNDASHSDVLLQLKTSHDEITLYKQQLNSLDDNLKHIIKENKDLVDRNTNVVQELENKEAEIVNLHQKLDSLVSQNEENYAALENRYQSLKEEITSKSVELTKLRSSEADLMASLASVQQDKASLEAKLNAVEGSLHSSDSSLSELIETNQNLAGKLYQLERQFDESEKKVALLEQNFSSERNDLATEIKRMAVEMRQLNDQRKELEDKNTDLNEKLRNAYEEMENMRNDFYKKKADFDALVNEMSSSKEDSDKTLAELQSELVKKNEFIVRLEGEVAGLKTHCCEMDNHKLQVLKLEKDNAILHCRLEEQQSMSAKSEIVDESEILVSLSAELQTQPISQDDHDDSSQLRNKLSYFEDHFSENVQKVDKLMSEIENYRKVDSSNREKLCSLEKQLKEMREKETRMSVRVCELEEREKELLAQIADIEATVIIPLEAENQELKDELSMVKQERDDAQARVSKWGDEEEDQQDVETVHKCLEDALITRDELEKKVQILCEDVSKLEQEKDNLMKKIVDLEASEADHIDKIESLEDEVERLYGLEKTRSVVEETETCLMDRVLDLEEKEQQLLAELEQLKNKNVKSGGDVTDGQLSYESLLEKLKYLEQKNAMLQDAEGRYMDKIVELEEIQHRLQSQLLTTHSSGDSTDQNSDSIKSAFVSADSILLSMQQTGILKNNADSSNKSKTPSNDTASVCVDTSDLILHSEQTVGSTDVSFKTAELENQIKNLTTELTDKTSRLQFLEEKCELLCDSESKLMEKLLDHEDGSARNKDSSDSEDSELKKKIENLLEENEFLAESIESFKQLYKEEKEKTIDLQDRLMDNTSVIQELHDTKAELKTTQQMVEEIQSEYEEELSVREEHAAQLSKLLTQSQQREKDLQAQIAILQQREEDLQRKLNVLVQDGGEHQQFEKLLTDEKTEALQQLELEMKSHYHQLEKELQQEIQTLQAQKLEQQADRDKQALEHQSQMEVIQEDKEELQKRVHNLTAKELDLQKHVISLSQREHDMLGQIDRLEKQLEDMKAKLALTTEGTEEESFHSDSGMSADDHHVRYFTSEKGRSEYTHPLESPVTSEVFSSSITFNLAQPLSSAHKGSTASQNGTPPPEPVPPPRRKSHRSSIDSVSQEELVFLVEELQSRESALKKRLRELESVADSDLTQKVEELEFKNQNLERKLKFAESQLNRLYTESPTHEKVSSESSFIHENNESTVTAEENLEDLKEVHLNVSSVLTSHDIMLDKPEDVLHKRIKELENLDKHNKTQLSELERDREVLHEIARKDKATIHDLNVKIRELQLSERSLKEQVNSLETSESSLFSKCEDLEAIKARLEDRVHELSVHERRLRELVRKLKLDEEHWLSKSGGMESAVAELAANEQQLKRLLQDVEMEKGGLSERSEYLEARLREMESVEASLLQRLKNYENIEVSLQNRLIQLENSERAAHSKVSELDVMNLDLSQRLQKALEDNVLLTQHVTQLQGRIHELDRRLLSLEDSELAYKQHTESLSKNESLLQKKIREFELREIDSQARVRELEQINDILNDKIATLQRSENRLKLRVQELEGVVGQGRGEVPAAQKYNVLQQHEDCQKQIMLLQNQVDNLQQQLKQAQKTTQSKLVSKVDDAKKVSLSFDEYRQLQTKSALLEETMYQMEEVEKVNMELKETILQLRQGKGASGHEVEIEVLKRRLASYKTFINKLKSSLSMGQATSLWDPELDSGLQGDTLPARPIHGLESERVLQTVRGLQEGKADTSNVGGAQQFGFTTEKDAIVESKATLILSSSRPASVDNDEDSGSSKSEQTPNKEESHWRAIEARKPKLVASSRGGAVATLGKEAKQALPTNQNVNRRSSTPEVEEVTIGLHLQSESELSSHQRTHQNDTDSSSSPVPPPRRARANRAGKSINSQINYSGNESSDGTLTESDISAKSAQATDKKHFDKDKSLPSPANTYTSKEQSLKRAPLTRFGEDSFYLPSSTQEGVDSLDDGEAPPLPRSVPPGAERLTPTPQLSDGSVDKKDSLDSSSSGMSIRDRIAMIERQFHPDKHGDKADDDQVVYWKRKAGVGLKRADMLEKDNKHLRDEINRLEKELEEKRRYIHLLELWLSNLEELLKNKNKQTDRQLMEQLHQELTKLRSELKQIGYRREDAVMDPAALRTELENRNKEIVSKRNEIEALTGQLKDCQKECRNIEGMRRTTLDCLRSLEHEIVELQNKELRSQETQTELESLKSQTEKTREVYEENLNLRNRLHQNEAELARLRHLCDDFNNLSARYDEMENSKQQAKNMVQPLKTKLERLARKCQEKDVLLCRLGAELRRSTYRPSSALDDLGQLEKVMGQEEYNTDFPQMVSRPTPLVPDKHRAPSPSSSLDELELTQPYSDTDSVPAFSKRKRPAPYISSRPRSADNFASRHRIQRGDHAHPHSVLDVRKPRVQPEFMRLKASQGHFVAIADYDPTLFSQSGRPELELELREGELVHVTGPVDRTGYLEAEVNGRVGLVPASYLQPLHGNSHMTHYSSEPWLPEASHSQRPEEMMDIYRHLHLEPSRRSKESEDMNRRGDNFQAFDVGKMSNIQTPIPDPPSNISIKNIIHENTILLSWLPPRLDNKGNNHGIRLLGFMVFLDNQEYAHIQSPRICEIVMENLNLEQPHRLAVQSLYAGGHVSPRTELVFEGTIRMSQDQGNLTRVPEQDDLDTDLSSVLNNVHYKRGHRRTVIALYDYNPEQQSPLNYTSFELAFQVGQLLYVYGDPRPDGFFYGEIDGKQGLVPACFVEDLSEWDLTSQKRVVNGGPHTNH